MEADINGPQRKILESRITPVRPSHGRSGIAVRDGRTLPFRVHRVWSAPAGHYFERFYLIDPSTSEVLYESPGKEVHVLGLQARTALADEVKEPIDLQPGTYEAVFALGGVKGGTVMVETAEPSGEAA